MKNRVNHKELKVVQSVLGVMASQRRFAVKEGSEADEEAMVDLIARTHREEGIEVDLPKIRAFVKEAIACEEKPEEPGSVDADFLDKQALEIEEMSLSLQNKPFYSNRELLALYPARKPPKAYWRYFAFLGVLGLSMATRNPWLVFFIVGVGWFWLQFVSDKRSTEWKQELLLKQTVLDQNMDSFMLILDYQYRTVSFEWRVLNERTMAEIKSNYAIQWLKKKVFNWGKKVPRLPFSMDLVSVREVEEHMGDLKNKASRQLVQYWIEQKKPIRRMDLFYSQVLDQKIEDYKGDRDFFDQ